MENGTFSSEEAKAGTAAFLIELEDKRAIKVYVSCKLYYTRACNWICVHTLEYVSACRFLEGTLSLA